jgi:hypothetical protein
MPALIQTLHDNAIGGTISWVFDGAWKAEMGLGGGFTVHGGGMTADEVEIWMAMTAATSEKTSFTASGDLKALQSLHDAEVNGSVTWWKPDKGFVVTLADEGPERFGTWQQAQPWLLSRFVFYAV